MGRLVFESGLQRTFLLQVQKALGYTTDGLGQLVGISGRSFRDWLNEKTLGRADGLLLLSELSGVTLPSPIEVREEHWSGRMHGRKGALQRLKLQGPPGTAAGRSKGGRVSQQRRRENPEFYRQKGCIIPNYFTEPNKSAQLAEFVGVVLGDGCITPSQVQITLNSVADKHYISYVNQLVIKLFHYSPGIHQRKKSRAKVLTITGVNYVKMLGKLGLSPGDKVKKQVKVPDWVVCNRSFSIMCLRGLMDTDGGIFMHSYMVGKKRYTYLKLQFSNRSDRLRHFVFTVLTDLKLNPKHAGNKHVWLYSENEVIQYLDLVGSSNPRLTSVVE